MKFGSKNIQSLCYGSKGIVKVMFGSKLIWEKFNAEESVNTILKSVIDGNELNNMDNLLYQIESSNMDFTDINNQLEEIILSECDPLENPENYLTFEVVSNAMRISFSNNCQYSLGTNEWFDLEPGELTPMVEKGRKIYFKATGLVPNSSIGIGNFTIIGKCNLSGNCNSMLFGDDAETNLSLSGKSYAFYKLFYNCSTIIDASKLILPATTLDRSCYNCMFEGCTSLVTAPKLPVTNLALYCYGGMFQNCTSLVTAPKLPATTLNTGCYNHMFQNCSSLVSAPELPATKLAANCYEYMFYGCSSLTQAPELPATTLVANCYEYMFAWCTKLNYIKALFTTTPSTSYTSYWVYKVSSTGTFVKNVDATWHVTGVDGIPSGWTIRFTFNPIRCINLSITADDVSGRSTTTMIHWTADVEGTDDTGNSMTVTFTGTDTSESFPQNTSTTDTIERTISYTYMGVTATTTIYQGIWKDREYTVNLNNQWQSSAVTNPDSSLYEGVYESFSNKGVNNTAATMYIDIDGYTDFDLYIRSYAESYSDYVMVSQLDQTINNSTSYSNTTLIKAHTRGNQKSGTGISDYTKVSFTGIDEGQHRITIVYRKDSSVNSYDDRGYVLIPKNQ